MITRPRTRFSALLAALVFLAASARAGNVPELRVLGFSRAGNAFAVEEVWTADGSGFPYRRLHVVDVLRNAYLARITLGGAGWEGRGAALEREYVRQKAAMLRRHGLANAWPGEVLHRSPVGFPVSYAPRPTRAALDLRAGKTLVRLRLEAFGLPGACPVPDALPEGERTRGVRVTANSRTLQRDVRLPASRSCAYAYRIEEVRVLGEVVAVLLRVFEPGFEGPDAFGMIVTGRWR